MQVDILSFGPSYLLPIAVLLLRIRCRDELFISLILGHCQRLLLFFARDGLVLLLLLCLLFILIRLLLRTRDLAWWCHLLFLEHDLD